MKRDITLRQQVFGAVLAVVLGAGVTQQAGASAVVQSGESVTFGFEFSPSDIAIADDIVYSFNVTQQEGGSISSWTGTVRLLDELGEAPLFTPSSGPYADNFSFVGFQPALFDDTISYVVVDFSGAMLLDSTAIDTVSMSMIAYARDNGTPFVAVDGSLVPIPAAIYLFISGLLGMFGMSRRKNSA